MPGAWATTLARTPYFEAGDDVLDDVKYPRILQAFFKSCVTFHPAGVNLPGARFGVGVERASEREG